MGAAGSASVPGGAFRVRRVLTTRRGGVSRRPYDSFNLGDHVGDDPRAVAANRARLAAGIGVPPRSIVWMDQVHGTRVVTVGRGPDGSVDVGGGPGRGPVPATDGIVTATVDLALAVLVADCVPILAGESRAGVVAAVHAGRRGAADGIADRMLDEMTTAGAHIESVEVLLGPAACGRCYEVPAELRDEVEAALPGSASTTDRGTPGLDLRAGLARRLRDRGVAGVAVDNRCTITDPDLFSHRRGAPTGRLAGVIWMDSTPIRTGAR